MVAAGMRLGGSILSFQLTAGMLGRLRHGLYDKIAAACLAWQISKACCFVVRNLTLHKKMSTIFVQDLAYSGAH